MFVEFFNCVQIIIIMLLFLLLLLLFCQHRWLEGQTKTYVERAHVRVKYLDIFFIHHSMIISISCDHHPLHHRFPSDHHLLPSTVIIILAVPPTATETFSINQWHQNYLFIAS